MERNTLEELITNSWSYRIYGSGEALKSGETIILEDESGAQLVAIVSDEEVLLDANANDIRKGKSAATDSGVTIGTKVIPSYYTSEGYRLIPNGSEFVISLYDGLHEYTKLQAILCPFDSSLAKSVAAEKVVINDKVYPAKSAVFESEVTIAGSDIIDLGISNTFGIPYVIRYFTYKEVY